MQCTCSAHAATLRPCEKRGEEGASQLSRRTLGAVLVVAGKDVIISFALCPSFALGALHAS